MPRKPGDGLTAKQRKVAQLLAVGDPDTFETYTKVQICEMTDTARSTLYSWLQDDGFTNYVEYLTDLYIRSKIPMVDRKLVKGILDTDKPNSRLMETFYKRTGKLKEVSKVDATIEDNRDVSSKSNDELLAELEILKREAGRDDT